MCFSVEDVYIGKVIECANSLPIDNNTYLFTNENGFSLELEYSFPPCSTFTYEIRDCDGVIKQSFSAPFLDLKACSTIVKVFISAGLTCDTISVAVKTTRNVGDYESETLVAFCFDPRSFTISLGGGLCLGVIKQ